MGLHDVYISLDTGECLLHKDYGSVPIEEQFVTGFLSAVNTFSNKFLGKNLDYTKIEANIQGKMLKYNTVNQS